MKKKSITITIKPEIIYPCPDCGLQFTEKKYLLKHYPQCMENALAEDAHYKYVFLTPRTK